MTVVILPVCIQQDTCYSSLQCVTESACLTYNIQNVHIHMNKADI